MQPGGVALPPIVTPPQYQAQGVLRGVVQPLEMAWPGAPAGQSRHSTPSTAGQDAKAVSTGGQMPGFPSQEEVSAETIMAKLLTDVRPWGSKSRDTVITSKYKGGSYLKKGAGVHVGSVNSSITYSQRFVSSALKE